MSADIETAAHALMEAAERARRDELVSIEEQRIVCRAIVQGYDDARERLALLDAEYARVEAQKSKDLARQALEALQAQPKPEPYRAGLPPERLRKVWAEWEMVDGVVYVFQGNKYRCTYRPPTEWWDIGAEHTWRASYRPHGATWSRVEAMADEAEKPTLLDLTTLPPGTEVQLMEACNTSSGSRLALGQKVKIAGVGVTENDGSTWVISALVPARVVKEGGER